MPDFKNIAGLLNATTREVLGEEATLINEDLSNVVDFGKQIIGSQDENKFLTNFCDRIGKVVVYDRTYSPTTDLGILKDNIQFGTIMQRQMIDELPEFEDSDVYELTDGASVDPFVVKLPKASAKYFNNRNTWKTHMTILSRQYRSAFTSPTALSSFVASVFNAVENSKRIKLESLQFGILRSAISATLKDDIPDGDYTNNTTIKSVNLLKLYNDEVNTGADISVAEALTNKEFLRFASKTINEYVRAIQSPSVLYNIEKAARFTPIEKLHLTVLGKFVDSVQYYLEADTWHNNLVSLPGYSSIDKWQGTGNDRSFNTLSSINVKNADNDVVEASGIIGVLYDTEGLCITCDELYADVQHNSAGQYDNYYWFGDWASAAFKDMNFVVFFVA